MRLTANADGSPSDRDRAIGVLRRPIELGVNHIDTAAFYFSPRRFAKRADQPRIGAISGRPGHQHEGRPAIEKLIGSQLFALLRSDWRAGQAKEVRDALADPANRVWVAQAEGAAVGFVAAKLHYATGIGEIHMIAVDPRHQGGGTGTALTETATDWFRARGMRVAMIETGGDPGHAPARRVYEKAGYRALPAVRFFKALQG